jgi:hypothetical protein
MPDREVVMSSSLTLRRAAIAAVLTLVAIPALAQSRSPVAPPPSGGVLTPSDKRPTPPRVVGAAETREALLDILDKYEWMFKTLPLPKDRLDDIERARATVLQISDDRMQVFADKVGPDLVHAEALLTRQVAGLHAKLKAMKAARAARDAADGQGMAVAKSAGFPSLRTDVPEYANDASASEPGGGVDDEEIEAEEESRESAESEAEDEGNGSDSDGSWAALGALCDMDVNADGRAARASTSDVLGARLIYAVFQLVQSVCSRICDETVVVNCSLCCIPTDVVEILAQVVFDAYMTCQDDADSAEIEAAYLHAKTNFDAIKHVHGDVEDVQASANVIDSNVVTTLDNLAVVDGKVDVVDGKVEVIDGKLNVIDGNVDIILDNTTCHVVSPLVALSGCNGNDDDCDKLIDECDEDIFAPEVHVDAAVSIPWFASAAEASAAVAKAVLVTGECHTFTVSAPTLSGTCGSVTASVTVTDACGNATTVTTPLKIDGSNPTVSIPAALGGSCHATLAAAEAAVLAAATISDDCTPLGALDVRVESAVSECNLRVRIEATDKAGHRGSAAVTVRVDAGAPKVALDVLRLGFRSAPLGFQDPACYSSIGAAEAAVLAAASVSDNCGGGPAPTVASSGDPCSLKVTVGATDACGASDAASVVVRVDTTGPSTTASVTRDQLWPASHDLRDVGFRWSATDNCPGNPAVRIIVTSDEHTATDGADGGPSKAPDAEILRDIDGRVVGVRLRAERDGAGNGRVYRITTEAVDPCGNLSRSWVNVSVPATANGAAIDDGQFYDATAVN